MVRCEIYSCNSLIRFSRMLDGSVFPKRTLIPSPCCFLYYGLCHQCVRFQSLRSCWKQLRNPPNLVFTSGLRCFIDLCEHHAGLSYFTDHQRAAKQPVNTYYHHLQLRRWTCQLYVDDSATLVLLWSCYWEMICVIILLFFIHSDQCWFGLHQLQRKIFGSLDVRCFVICL